MSKLDQLKLLKEKKQSEANTQKQPLYSQIHDIDNQLTTEINSLDIEIKTLEDAEKLKGDFKKQIQLGTFTLAEYNALSTTNQEIFKDALFEVYSDEKINQFRAASALEFMSIYISKLLLLTVDRTKLTTAQQSVLTQYETIINQHPMSTDVVDWEIPYVQTMMNLIIPNRTEYKAKKIEYTGSF
jgi:hypothetical protein